MGDVHFACSVGSISLPQTHSTSSPSRNASSKNPETRLFISKLKLITGPFMKFSTLILFVPNDFDNGITDSSRFPYN